MPVSQLFRDKMHREGLSDLSIQSFEHSLKALDAGASATIRESELRPVTDLQRFNDDGPVDDGLLDHTVVIKLNGGLGTSMGLNRAKCLLPLRGEATFLDLIADQIMWARTHNGDLRFLAMNSFSTSADTRAALADRHPGLGSPDAMEMLQHRVPKVALEGLCPLEYPQNPMLEWCPPGHGDIYPTLLDSGQLHALLRDGIRYAFISNSDNLGATLSPALLTHFARSNAPFLMEVTRRTAADRKGGHLAVRTRDGQLVLRESAQCAPEDVDDFQDIQRHRYFNTNNLWLRLDVLAELLTTHDGILPLPVIQNHKHADPRNPSSPRVIQLETAMGSAIECIPGSAAIEVGRGRFAPVKTTSDLFALRSDAYTCTADARVQLSPERAGLPVVVQLDPAHYRHIDALDRATPEGVPSLIRCAKLVVEGPVRFAAGTRIEGTVILKNSGPIRTLAPRTYADETVVL